MTTDHHFVCVVCTLLENYRFFVELDGKRSIWRLQRNGVRQGSVLALLLFITHKNDQPIYQNTRSFVSADDIAIAAQDTDFAVIEETLSSALVRLTEYYETNQLRANPTKTQVSLFHLRNRECTRQLNVNWNGVKLAHCPYSVYIGVTLHRTLSLKITDIRHPGLLSSQNLEEVS